MSAIIAWSAAAGHCFRKIEFFRWLVLFTLRWSRSRLCLCRRHCGDGGRGDGRLSLAVDEQFLAAVIDERTIATVIGDDMKL